MKHINEVVKSIVRMLRLTYGHEPFIGKVYQGLDKMVEHIGEVEKDANRDPKLRALCQE